MTEIFYSAQRLPIAAFVTAVVTEQAANDFNFILADKLPLGTGAQCPELGVLFGNFALAQFIAKRGVAQNNKMAKVLLYGSEDAKPSDLSSEKHSAAISQWCNFPSNELSLSASSPQDFDLVAQQLNFVLETKSFLAGNRLTIADLVVYENLRASKQWKSFSARFVDKVPNLARWASYLEQFVSDHTPVLVEATKKKIPTFDAMKLVKDGEEIALELPHCVMGKVVTRFPPEPSGYLHIGHAKAALLNAYFAKKYNGKLLLRFDDTNPAKEKAEYEHAITEDLKRMGIEYVSLTYTSDYFDKLLELGVELIKQGKAYVDDTPREQFTEMKLAGIPTPSRSNSVEKNLQMWEEMKKASDYGKTCCVRAKMDIANENFTLRDPVMIRYKAEHHPRCGNKYHLYPTYDYACPVVDSVEGVTHALRTSEYNDRNAQYYWFLDLLGIRKPFLWDYSRMAFQYTVMSKRKLTKLVDSKCVDAWSDPRMPTVQGLFRRGLTIEALYKFILSQSTSRSAAFLTWEKLWVTNKQIIDPIAPRFTTVNKQNIVKFMLNNGPKETEVKEVLKHKKNEKVGKKNVYYTSTIYLEQDDAAACFDNEEVTLMDWGNAIIKQIKKDDTGKVVEMVGELNLKGNVKTTEKKLHWLPCLDTLIDTELVFYDHILTKAILDKNDEFEKFVAQDTKHVHASFADPNVKELKKGDIIQFERRGYFIVDQAYDNGKIVFVNIPDGSKQ